MGKFTWKKNEGIVPINKNALVVVKFIDGSIVTQKAGSFCWIIEKGHPAAIEEWMLKSEYDEDLDTPDPGAHYRAVYKGIKLDPFRICEIYGITSLGQATLVKKSLRLGTSIKDKKQDLLDIINCAERMLEMIEESKDENSYNNL